MRHILIESRVGDFVGSLKLEYRGWVDGSIPPVARLRFYLDVHKGRYSKRYMREIRCSEGESYRPYLHEFISNLSSPNMVIAFFREADRESQLREGYYRAMEHMNTDAY